MVDFLVKKCQLLNEIRWRHYDMAPSPRWITYGSSAKHGKKYGGVSGKVRHAFRHVFTLRNDYIMKYHHQTLFFGVGRPREEVCVAQHKEANPMSFVPPPPPTALPVAAMVMAATRTAKVTVAGATTTTTAVGASMATMAAAAAAATRGQRR